MKTKNMAVWINGKVTYKEEIKKYKRTDFSYYTYSFVHKNARSKRFPQEYQYTLYTKKYFDENLKNSHLHFSNDTLKLVISEAKKDWKKIDKILSPKKEVDTAVWYTKEKEGYNLYINEKKEKKIIVIDAGHGGTDLGATKDDLNEKNLISEITKKIKSLYSDSDVTIHFTRTDDEFIDLKNRTNLINAIKPDLVISLHINSSKNIDKNGFEIFITDKIDFLDENKILAGKLSSKLSKTQLKNRGLKTAPFHILKNSSCPSMVVELGFISNENDRKFIASEKGQAEIAEIILEFISDIK
jgi:N-acetylmuramoyl-L-alanine amidase